MLLVGSVWSFASIGHLGSATAAYSVGSWASLASTLSSASRSLVLAHASSGLSAL